MTQNYSSGRLIGYARVSTERQDWAYQLERLQVAGCTKLFREKCSGKNITDRPQLRKMLRTLQKGDTVIATLTDRIARDAFDLLSIFITVRTAGASLRLLDEPYVDTQSMIAVPFYCLQGWAAEMHRLRILENTANGRERARQRGVKFGRPMKLTPSQRNEALAKRRSGQPASAVARMFGVSESTISRLGR